MEVCPRQLLVLKALLNTFTDSTSLRVNYSKSSMYPINIPEDKLQHMPVTFHCQVGNFPFTYLGLPLSTSNPTIHDCLPMALRIEKRLISTSLWLTQGGKLQLLNSIMLSLPTFYMCTIKLPILIINQIDKYRRHYLWRGGDLNTKKPLLAAWKLVTRPKKKGGLGVLKLRVQNGALLMKNLHKFFSKANLPWVKLIWNKYYGNGSLPGQRKKGSFW
jgi:hypothetical protein